MLRELSQDMVAGLKDTLRDVRYTIRTRRSDWPGPSTEDARSARRDTDRIVGRVAAIMDDAFTLAETVSLSLVPAEMSPRRFGLRGLTAYFEGEGPARLTGARLFRREMYQGARQILRRQGFGEARIHETGFLTAYAAVERKHAELLRRIRQQARAGDLLEPTSTLCAALLVEMMAGSPIRLDAAGTLYDMRDVSLRCLAPLVIAYGVATLNPAGASDAQILEEALLVAEARHDRIVKALEGERPVEQLHRIFAAFLKHLP